MKRVKRCEAHILGGGSSIELYVVYARRAGYRELGTARVKCRQKGEKMANSAILRTHGSGKSEIRLQDRTVCYRKRRRDFRAMFFNFSKDEKHKDVFFCIITHFGPI